MSLTKLGSLAVRLAHKNLLSRRLTGHGSMTLLTLKNNKTTVAVKNVAKDEEDELDKPIKFSGSKASTWSAVASRMGQDEEDKPWFQSYVIIVSVTVFMVYFCVLREENDVDEKLTLQLSDHFQGERKINLEKSQEIYQNFAQQQNDKRVNHDNS